VTGGDAAAGSVAALGSVMALMPRISLPLGPAGTVKTGPAAGARSFAGALCLDPGRAAVF